MSKKKKHAAPADENLFEDMDDHFAFIAGYTPGGFPYGTTYAPGRGSLLHTPGKFWFITKSCGILAYSFSSPGTASP